MIFGLEQEGGSLIAPMALAHLLHPIDNRARFPSLARSKLRLCLANHRAGYFSNLTCDWLSIA